LGGPAPKGYQAIGILLEQTMVGNSQGNFGKEDLEMAIVKLDGKVWYRCDHLSNAMRKTFGFRMIGKFLYCSPIK